MAKKVTMEEVKAAMKANGFKGNVDAAIKVFEKNGYTVTDKDNGMEFGFLSGGSAIQWRCVGTRTVKGGKGTYESFDMEYNSGDGWKKPERNHVSVDKGRAIAAYLSGM